MKIVEYINPSKELFTNYSLLGKILGDIWKILGEFTQKTNLKFQKIEMNELDQLDLVCAYMVEMAYQGEQEHRVKGHAPVLDGAGQHSRAGGDHAPPTKGLPGGVHEEVGRHQ